MKIRIRNAADFIKYYEFEIEFSTDKPFSNLIPLIQQKLSKKTSPENLKFTLIHSNENKLISNYEKSLSDLNYRTTDAIQVEKTNQTLTINHSHGISLGYFCPIILSLICLFYLKGIKHSHPLQILYTSLIIQHYSKRIFEVYYVHINGVKRISIDRDYLGFFIYYSVIFGVFVNYELFTHNFLKIDTMKTSNYVFLFLFCEVNNYRSHNILRNLKLKLGGQRGIPFGGMFEYVSSAHYFWELGSWVSFSLMTNLYSAYLFAFLSFVSMGFLAYKKHQSYLEYFGEKYPKNRKAFIPFIF